MSYSCLNWKVSSVVEMSVTISIFEKSVQEPPKLICYSHNTSPNVVELTCKIFVTSCSMHPRHDPVSNRGISHNVNPCNITKCNFDTMSHGTSFQRTSKFRHTISTPIHILLIKIQLPKQVIARWIAVEGNNTDRWDMSQFQNHTGSIDRLLSSAQHIYAGNCLKVHWFVPLSSVHYWSNNV